MQKITPHLWYDKQAKEAAEFYASAIPDSKVTSVRTITGTPSGDCDIVSFELAGHRFQAISAGPYFTFNPSISFTVRCADEAEIDAIWAKLSEGGKTLMPLQKYPFAEKYGWCSDRYGLSWQLIIDARTPQKVIPFLMFVRENAGKAEEAMRFYMSIFEDSNMVGDIFRHPAGGAEKEGTVAHAEFQLAGQRFMALDSALDDHAFNFNEAVSLIVSCDDQAEIDYFWGKLSAVPEAEQCGWLKDKYGVSWQIVPRAMDEMMAKGAKEQIDRVTQAFLKMKKFDIAELQKAYEGN